MSATLYIVRHAWAGEHGDPRYPDDSLRPLTDEGRKRFRRVAKALAERGVEPTVVATSPLVRCRQTADVLGEALAAAPEIVPRTELAPGGDIGALIEWTQTQEGDIAWVGHAPDVNNLLAHLIADDCVSVRFAKGAVAAIEFADRIDLGAGELRWLVTARILGC
jgi:phosphohistidine phosphatase